MSRGNLLRLNRHPAALVALLAMLLLLLGPLIGQLRRADDLAFLQQLHCGETQKKIPATDPLKEACGYCHLLLKIPSLPVAEIVPATVFWTVAPIPFPFVRDEAVCSTDSFATGSKPSLSPLLKLGAGCASSAGLV